MIYIGYFNSSYRKTTLHSSLQKQQLWTNSFKLFHISLTFLPLDCVYFDPVKPGIELCISFNKAPCCIVYDNVIAVQSAIKAVE